MDNVYHPNKQAWISKPFMLEETAEYVNQFAGLLERSLRAPLSEHDGDDSFFTHGDAINFAAQRKWDLETPNMTITDAISNFLNGDKFLNIQMRDERGCYKTHNNNCNDVQHKTELREENISIKDENDALGDSCENEPELNYKQTKRVQKIIAAYHTSIIHHKNAKNENTVEDSDNSLWENFSFDSDDGIYSAPYEYHPSVSPRNDKDFNDWVHTTGLAKLTAKCNIKEEHVYNRLVKTDKYEPLEKTTSSSQVSVLKKLMPGKSLQYLKSYITHGVTLFPFHWAPSNVQQKMTKDLDAEEYLSKISQNNSHKANSNSMLVDKQNDFVVTVAVFHPSEFYSLHYEEIKPVSKPKLAMEWAILSTTTLAELRDICHCENDLVDVKEIYHPIDHQDVHFNENSTKAIFPSGCILINDTIYNDMRSDKCIDTAEIINKWTKSTPAKNVGPFQVGDMSTTQIKDLELRFGYPYIYVHQGSCEHLIVFSLARNLHEEDPIKKISYPVLERFNFKNISCQLDNRYLARWAVLDCERLPESPTLLCTKCVESYCFDKDGKKIGSFRLYNFKQVANIV